MCWKQAIRQRKPYNTHNSFVAPQARDTFQVDVGVFKTESRFGKSPYKFGLFAIDIFSKRLTVIPLKDILSEHTAKALDKVVTDLGLCLTVHTDLGGEFQAAFAERLKYYDIKHLQTRTAPNFVERSIRTIKEMIENAYLPSAARGQSYCL